MTYFINNNWDLYLDKFSNSRKDIYFEEKYVKLYEDDNNEAVCFIYEEDSNILLFPFLRRKFIFDNNIYYDFETPYGYGGPIIKEDDQIFLKRALRVFFTFCKNENYIAGFIRFHPLLYNCQSYDLIGTVIEVWKTIAIDISLSEEEIWMKEFNSKNRNLIRKAEKNELLFVVDTNYKYLDDFIHLYNETMSKLQADQFYYFDKKYFEKIKKFEQNFLGIVFYEEKIIAAAIFFYSKEYGHYHLSGSDLNHITMLPNNYLLYYAALELKRRGIQKFHLGGGTTSSDDDSLLRFKERYSKQKYQFYIGKTIFKENIYDKLIQKWNEENQNDPNKLDKYHHYLLKYKY